MPKAKTRKRRCKICKRWFLPDVRHADRQKTCSYECRRELHKKRCAKYNQKNRKSAKADYLQKKLDAVDVRCHELLPGEIDKSIGASRIDIDLPRDVIQKAIGIRLLVVIEYVAEQILQRRKLFGKTSVDGSELLPDVPEYRKSA